MAGYKSLIERLEGSPNARRRAEVEEVKRATYDDVIARQGHRRRSRHGRRPAQGAGSELGIDGILFELNFGAAIPAEMMMRSLKLICQEVMPHFK